MPRREPFAAREYVVLEVADTGSGIPPEILERIFDPFFTTKEVGVGTGLGLSLVHGIVTGLGGVIDVATVVGKGTVFTVYLPLAGDVAAPIKPRKRAQPRTRRGGDERILVVDDEESLVKLVTETLTELGYTTTGFTASASALGGVPRRSRAVRRGHHRRKHAGHIRVRTDPQDAGDQADDSDPARERLSQRGGRPKRDGSGRERGTEEAAVRPPARSEPRSGIA